MKKHLKTLLIGVMLGAVMTMYMPAGFLRGTEPTMTQQRNLKKVNVRLERTMTRLNKLFLFNL